MPLDYTSTTSATTSTWVVWNGIYTSNATSTSVETLSTGSAGTTTSVVWGAWNRTYVTSMTGSYQGNIIRGPAEAPQLRPGRVEAAEGERQRARERAQLLLREALNPKQREQFSKEGFFDLESIRPDGERRIYRIRRGRSRNVQQITPEGRILKTLCAHPILAVPDEDTMLAQKLWLETQEDAFLRLANHS